ALTLAQIPRPDGSLPQPGHGDYRRLNTFSARVNSPVTSGAADALKLSLVHWWRRAGRDPDVELLMPVHVELNFVCTAERAPALVEQIVSLLEAAHAELYPGIEVRVSHTVGRDWAGTPLLGEAPATLAAAEEADADA